MNTKIVQEVIMEAGSRSCNNDQLSRERKCKDFFSLIPSYLPSSSSSLRNPSSSSEMQEMTDVLPPKYERREEMERNGGIKPNSIQLVIWLMPFISQSLGALTGLGIKLGELLLLS